MHIGWLKSSINFSKYFSSTRKLHERNRCANKHNCNFISSIATEYNRKFHNKCSKLPPWASIYFRSRFGRSLMMVAHWITSSRHSVNAAFNCFAVAYFVMEILCSMTNHTEYSIGLRSRWSDVLFQSLRRAPRKRQSWIWRNAQVSC